MGLGEVLFRLGTKQPLPRAQQGGQAQSVDRDFIAKYLRCLGLSPNELDKAAEVLRGRSVNEDAIKCVEDLMRSASWDELFVKLNLEIALLEAISRREVQRLAGNGNNTSGTPLALSAYYNFVLSISIIRYLLSDESARPIAMATLSKMTYMLFDIYMEISKRKIIPPNLEVEIWKVRDVLVDVMEKLFKGDRTITVHDKSFDANRQLR
jgi:hypothetical protein